MVNSAFRSIIAAWLKDGMDDAGLNPTTLSRQSKVSRDTIYRILAGETSAGEATLRRLSETIGRPLLGVTVAPEGLRRPAEPRSDEERALTALSARLAFLRDQLRAYISLGQSPPPAVLAEWLRLTAETNGD